MTVANYRKFIGYTQKDFADILKISTQSYSRRERGVVDFTDNEKIKIKEIVKPYFPGVTIEDIFFSQEVTN